MKLCPECPYVNMGVVLLGTGILCIISFDTHGIPVRAIILYKGFHFEAGSTYIYISFSHEFGFCTRSAFFTHESFCPNRHTPFIPRTRAVAIFLPAVLQAYAQPLCLPFSLLRHLWHVSLNPDLFAFFLEY